ncbi:ADP-ribosylation factor family protein [Xylaria longipes]|nr:ADP-ribosylation factor family protein [Xylaria longipes]
MGFLDWAHTHGIFGLVNKRTKVLILGLNNAGKSTLLTEVAHNRRRGLQPTRRPTSEELVTRNVTFVAIDFGSDQQGRRLWGDHLHDVGGIVFLVDVADRERFAEAKAELDALLDVKEIQAIPIVVLGNKMDNLYAVSAEELRYELDLERICDRPIQLWMCSIALKQGYWEGLRWLARHI